MVVAAFGYLPPGLGRASCRRSSTSPSSSTRSGRLRDTTSASRLSAEEAAIARRFSAEHPRCGPTSRGSATSPTSSTPPVQPSRSRSVRDVHRFLVEELDPHEEAEDATCIPVLARVLGGNDPTGTMSRAHVEIAHLIRRLGRVLDDLDPAGPDDDDIVELRRLLYGLHADPATPLRARGRGLPLPRRRSERRPRPKARRGLCSARRIDLVAGPRQGMTSGMRSQPRTVDVGASLMLS